MPDPSWAHRTALLLAGVALLAFAPTLTNGLVWDDPALVEAVRQQAAAQGGLSLFLHPYSMSEQGSSRATRYYRPLPSLSLLLDSTLPGGALPFHLTNLLLFAVATYLVARLLALLLPGRGAVAAGGLLFALHPLHLEVVAPAFGRSDLLMSVLLLASVLSWLRVRRGIAPRPRREAAASHLLLLLACLSKETAAAGPLLMMGWWAAEEALRRPQDPPGPGRWEWARGILRWLPGWAAAVGGSLLLRRAALGGEGAAGVVDSPGLLHAPLSTLAAGLEGIARLIVPWPQRLLHFPSAGIPPAETFLGAALLLLLLLLAFPRGRRRQGAVAALWVAAFLLPVLLLPRGGAPMADRFLFLPVVGLSLAGGWAFAALAGKGRVRAAAGGSALLLASFVLLLASFMPAWKGEEPFYRAMIRSRPGIAVGWNNLGGVMLRQGRWEEAARAFGEAARLDPGDARALSSLGVALEVLGRREEALEAVTRAEGMEPGWGGGSFNLGLLLRAAGRREEAAEAFRRAVEKDPAGFRGRLYLVLSLHEAGRGEEAREARRELTRLFPVEARELDRLLGPADGPSP